MKQKLKKIILEKHLWFNDTWTGDTSVFHNNKDYVDSFGCPYTIITTEVWNIKDAQWFLDRGWSIRKESETWRDYLKRILRLDFLKL